MKFIFEKIAHGFLFGIGLSLVLGIFLYFAYTAAEEYMDASEDYSYPSDADLIEITKHRELERDGKLLILGELKNIGEESTDAITLNVDLFQDGEFVKQCDEYLDGSLDAGEARNFELSCGGGCSNDSIVEHDSYKVYITSSY
ncbi:MAG: hypothetical protein ACKE8R_04205 [Methylophagaceae bacterium]